MLRPPKGARCRECKSQYELTRHHDRDPELARTNPKKSSHTIILCITCHWQVDFWKTFEGYYNGMWRRYNDIMKRHEKRWHYASLGEFPKYVCKKNGCDIRGKFKYVKKHCRTRGRRHQPWPCRWDPYLNWATILELKQGVHIT